jgi:hypothetical protein
MINCLNTMVNCLNNYFAVVGIYFAVVKCLGRFWERLECLGDDLGKSKKSEKSEKSENLNISMCSFRYRSRGGGNPFFKKSFRDRLSYVLDECSAKYFKN